MNTRSFVQTVTYTPSHRVCCLAISICLLSAFDALFTLLFVTDGGSEANPYAAQALAYGSHTFVAIKMVLTSLGAWVLAALHEVFLAYAALHGFTVFYIVLITGWVVWLF